MTEQTTDLLTSNKNDIQSIKQKQIENSQIPSGNKIQEKFEKLFEAYTLFNSNKTGTREEKKT